MSEPTALPPKAKPGPRKATAVPNTPPTPHTEPEVIIDTPQVGLAGEPDNPIAADPVANVDALLASLADKPAHTARIAVSVTVGKAWAAAHDAPNLDPLMRAYPDEMFADGPGIALIIPGTKGGLALSPDGDWLAPLKADGSLPPYPDLPDDFDRQHDAVTDAVRLLNEHGFTVGHAGAVAVAASEPGPQDLNTKPPMPMPMENFIPAPLLADAVRFTDDQQVYGDPRKATVFIRALIEALRDKAREEAQR